MDLLPLLQATGTLVALFLLSKIWMSKNTTTNKHANKTFTQAPQPKGAWPILGHLHLLGGQIPLFRTLAAMADQHGPIFTIRLGFRQAVVVSSKQTVTECFTVNDRAFMSRPQTAALKYMGYNGAFSALGPSDDYWLQLRKVTTRDLLSNRHLESFKHVRALEMDLSIKELYSLSIKNGQVTMNLILRAIVGKRYGFGDCESDKEARQFARTMEEFAYLSGAPECSDVIPGIEWLDLQGNVKAMKRNGKEMDKFMSMWLEEHVQSRREGKVKKDERDFMDVLLSCFPEDGDGMVFGYKSQDIIKATALSLIIGGSDTVTAALSWAVSLLLNNPTTLKAAQHEIDMYVGHGNVRWLDESDTKNLVYLQAIIKETLRLYPPGPLSIPRESIQDCHVSGYYVPKGTRLIVNVWKLHRDPHIWTNPDEFRPERFLAWQAKEDLIKQQFELIPFGAGRRSCPGSTLAYKIMHLILARLLQGFDLETLSRNEKVDMSEGLGIVLPKATPLEVLLTPRLSSEFYDQP
ncbi:unnamed protein product [Camellia sinensis]